MPTTGGAVIIVVAFMLPGFVTVLLQERTFKDADNPSQIDRVLSIFWYSGWTYALLAVAALISRVHWHAIVHFYHRHTDNPAELFVIGAGLVMTPSIVIEEATRRWHEWKHRDKILGGRYLRINPRHLVPTAWDSIFDEGRQYMVRVRMRDGHQVLGFYGGGSFAAYAKDGGDLFLETVYEPNANGWFDEEREHTEGVWIRASEAVLVEFYPVWHDGRPPGSEAEADSADRWPKGLRWAQSAYRRCKKADSASTAQEEGGVDDGREGDSQASDRGSS